MKDSLTTFLKEIVFLKTKDEVKTGHSLKKNAKENYRVLSIENGTTGLFIQSTRNRFVRIN